MSDEAELSPKKYSLSWGAISFIEAPSPFVLAAVVATLAASFVFCFVLSFFVQINVSVKSTGETDALAGVKDAVSPSTGQVYYLPVTEGLPVKKDQVIGWLRMEGTHEAQVRTLIGDLKNHLADIAKKTLSAPEAGLHYDFISDAPLRGKFAEIEKRYASLYNVQTMQALNAANQMRPMQKRQRTVATQLAYVEKSPLRMYLTMQKEALEDENGKLAQQIATLQSDVQTRTFDAKSDAEQALRGTIAALEEFIIQHQIRSPGEGQIAKLYVSQGTYLRDQQPVASIIPKDSPIVAKLFIKSSDLSKVKAGGECRVSIDAYPSYKYGYFKGEVLNVDTVKGSASAGVGTSGGAEDGFVARVSIDVESLSRRPAFVEATRDPIHLYPGMKVEAQIISKRASLAALAIDKIFGKDP